MGTGGNDDAGRPVVGGPACRPHAAPDTGQDLSNDFLERQPAGFEDIYE